MSILKKEVKYIINLIGFKIIFDYFNYPFSRKAYYSAYIYNIFIIC